MAYQTYSTSFEVNSVTLTTRHPFHVNKRDKVHSHVIKIKSSLLPCTIPWQCVHAHALWDGLLDSCASSFSANFGKLWMNNSTVYDFHMFGCHFDEGSKLKKFPDTSAHAQWNTLVVAFLEDWSNYKTWTLDWTMDWTQLWTQKDAETVFNSFLQCSKCHQVMYLF